MKNNALATATALLLAAYPLRQASAQSSGSLAVGSRYHVDHSAYEALPFTGNFSAAAAYEFHDEAGYWQVALDYVPAFMGSNAVDAVYTPQLNLVFNDGIWRGGAGVLNSYVDQADSTDPWTGFYWQFMAGINLPLQKLDFDLMVFYVFENWRTLREFDLKDLEFGVWLNFDL